MQGAVECGGAAGGGGHAVAVDGVEAGDGVAEGDEVLRPDGVALEVASPVGGAARALDGGERGGEADEFADEGVGQFFGEGGEAGLVGGGFAAAGAGEGDDPLAVLDGQDEAEPAGLPGAVVAVDADHGERAGAAARGAVEPGGVGDAGVDDVLLRRGDVEGAEPLGEPGAAAGGVDDDVGREVGRGVPVEVADRDAGDAGGVAEQGDGLGPGPERDAGVGEGEVADGPVEERAAGGEEELGLGESLLPAVGGQRDHVPVDADALGARGLEPFGGAGQQGLDEPRAAGPQEVGVAGLGQPFAVLGAVGELVALDDGDPVEMPPQHACCQHPGQSPSEYQPVCGSGHRQGDRSFLARKPPGAR